MSDYNGRSGSSSSGGGGGGGQASRHRTLRVNFQIGSVENFERKLEWAQRELGCV
jgi:hypothetical protein